MPLDTLQPTYVTVDAQGNASADFTGTIAAHGFDFYDDVYGWHWQLQDQRPLGQAPAWVLVSPTWGQAKALGLTWGQFKTAIAGGSWIAARLHVRT